MEDAIKSFNKQFSYKPEIINEKNLAKKSSFVSIGMGGSNLAPRILKTWDPSLNIAVQSDYGLSEYSGEDLKNKLIILSSYSGNTEEPVDAFKKAKEKNLNMAVIASGGELLKLAIENKIPYIKLPDTGIQPRMALGFSVKAFLKLLGREDELEKISTLSASLDPLSFTERGMKLAQTLKNYIPVIYSSNSNLSIAYNWKIKFNETGKIPAFYNVLPELNHNEMTGFDVKDRTRELSSRFYFILLKDGDDDPRVIKRMEVLEKLYKDRGFKVEIIDLEVNKGGDKWRKVFSSLLLADWAAYYTAMQYGLDAEQVPMVEEFKKLIS